MMKLNKFVFWLIAFLPLIVTLIVLPILPETLPAHYNISGVADRWGRKYEKLILPIFTVLFAVFLTFMSKQKNQVNKNQKALMVTNYISVIVFNALTYSFLYLAYSKAENLHTSNFNMMKILAVIISITYIFLGNILPKFKQNSIVGIRTKWTLESEKVWYKTHRLGGVMIMIYGIVSTILSLTLLNDMIALYVALGGFVLIAIFLIIYSYVIYKSDPN